MHTFKRIRYLTGQLPADASHNLDQIMQNPSKSENVAPNKPLDSGSKTQQLTVSGLKQEVAKQISTTMKKSVKISDDGFLTSLKRQLQNKSLSIESILTSEMGSSQGFTTISKLKAALSKSQYALDQDDVERLCQIANDKCLSGADQVNVPKLLSVLSI